MARYRVVGLIAAAALLVPAATASAHDATPVIDCGRVQIAYSSFAINLFGTNTVAYRMVLDGQTAAEGTFLLNDALGSSGVLNLPAPPADSQRHDVALYTWWGPPDTQVAFDQAGGSKETPVATGELVCPPPPPQPPSDTGDVGVPPAGGGQPVVAGAGAPAANAPTVAGQSTSGTQKARCAATMAKRYRVRAGQLNTVQVRVRNGSRAKAGATVRVTAPGVTQTRKTDGTGVATFRVRPKRSGRMTVSAAGCANPARVTVLGAKVSGATHRRPQFTG